MNIIKSMYKVMGCAVLVAGLSSCVNNWLDVTPSDSVDADNALTNSSSLEAAREGMYKALKGNSSFSDYYGAQMFVYGDVHAGDDYQSNWQYGSARADFYYLMTYQSASEFDANAIWQSPYIVISRANHILEAIDGGKLTDKDEADAKKLIAQYGAEAKVLRALAHFDLVRIYGKPYTEDQGASDGVPLVTTTLESAAKPKRSTVKEVYDQVLKDLTEAINTQALPDKPNTPGYVNEWGAKAILSRVYLNMGDYPNALATAKDVIEHSGAKLWTTEEYYNAWEAGSPNENEFLFRLNSTNSLDNNDLVGIGNLQQQGGYGDMIATETFVDAMATDPNDVRNELWDKMTITSEKQKADVEANYGTKFLNSKVFLNKLRGLGGNTRIVPIIPIIRLSEVYLTAAECAFRTNDKATAAQYLNDLIKNRTTDASKQVTAANITLDRILLERRKELVGEGQRYFDALRNNETIKRIGGWHSAKIDKDARSFNRDYFKAISAIPQGEINANKEIKQNPEYAE